MKIAAEDVAPYDGPDFDIGITPVDSDLGDDFGTESIPELAAFSSWLTNEFQRPEGERFQNITQGIALADARSEKLGELIRNDPQTAIRSAIPVAMRDHLPVEIAAASERFVEGTGDYGVSRICHGTDSRRLTSLELDGQRYSGNAYGSRSASLSNDFMPIHGIAVGEDLAISQSPIRIVSVDAARNGSGGVLAQFGDILLELASTDAVGDLARRQLQLERTPGKKTADATRTSARQIRTARSAYTEGTKKWLIIRVDFSDLPGTPVVGAFYPGSGTTMTPTYLKNQMDGKVGPLFEEISFGKHMISTLPLGDVTPVYRMPDTVAQYVARDIWDDLAADAKRAARNDGYTLSDYDHYYIVSSEHNGNFAGIATLGANDYAIGNGNLEVLTTVHEVGHNLGLDHSNFWKPDVASAPAGAGESIEYGDPFSLMGSDNSFWGVPNDATNIPPAQMMQLDWMTNSSYVEVDRPGTHRIYRYDSQTADQNRTLALKIEQSRRKHYWVAYRHDFDGLGGAIGDMSEGAYITVSGYGPWESSNLIDLGADPRDAQNDVRDASLNVGQSFSDPGAGVTITVTGKGGTGDDAYIDVTVTVPAPPLVDPVPPPASGVSADLSIQLTASENPTKFRVSGLPSGVKYNRTTGEIYGKPRKAGTYTIRVYAYNALGRSEVEEFQLVVQPMADDQVGIFEALVDAHPNLNFNLGGRLSLRISSRGTYSGVIYFGHENIRVRGVLDGTPGGDATFMQTVRRRDRSFLDVSATVTTTGAIFGTVEQSGGGQSTGFNGRKYTFHSRHNPATAFFGRYNTTIDLQAAQLRDPAIPQGAGFLMARIPTSGVARLTGYTADGVRTTGSCRMLDNRDGTADIPCFFRQSRASGSVLGTATVTSSNKSINGLLSWMKRASTSTRARVYKDGFGPIPLDMFGGEFVRPLPGEFLMGLTAGVDNGFVAFDAGGVNSAVMFDDLDQIVTIDDRHRVNFADRSGPVNPGRVRVSINRSTGLVTGSFQILDPDPFRPGKDLRRTARFRGVVLPDRTEACGYFLLSEIGNPGAIPPVANNRSPILSGKVWVGKR